MSNILLKKDKSFYSIKKLHTKTNNGIIYENDYTTINNNDDLFDEIPLFTESNFKFKIRTSDEGKKRHVKMDWVLNESGETWTKNLVSGVVTTNKEKIVLKPNYTSLNDYAYYGSAVELIKYTIKDIILRFPGGIYITPDAPQIKVGDVNYYLVSNECQIDCWSNGVNSVDNDENHMRYLSYSFKDYVDENGNELTSAPIANISGDCYNHIVGSVTIGGKELSIYKDANGQNCLVVPVSTSSGIIIEPKEEIKKRFWDTLDDFERVLLNKDTAYTAIFDTPYTSDTGYYYEKKHYTWPTVRASKGYMPDLTSVYFQAYLESLLSLAEFHDSYDSDNMWRMMTHESIKNLDWSHIISGEDLDDIDNTRFKSMINLQGRQFDDLKRYISGIKSIGSLSYDNKNNTPDYFISDIVESKGWESVFIPMNQVESGDTVDFNTEFLKRLALSSDYINSMKGTRKGVEAILGLFGFQVNGKTPDVEIKEYYATIDGPLSYSSAACLRAEFDYVNADEMTNYMEGYPVALFEKEGEENSIVLYPWYDSNINYIGDFYYQCKGGWGKMNSLSINSATTINGDSFYTETEPYMLFLNDLKELTSLMNNKLKENMICYVYDISNIEMLYIPNEGESLDENDITHYFILNNINLSTELGYVNNDFISCYGWQNVKKSDLDEPTELGIKVHYLESLRQNSRGNNPHIGRGDYDFGMDYLMKYKQLFREAISEKECEINSEKIEDIRNFGFKFLDICSSGKCFIVMSENEEVDSLKNINLKNITIKFNVGEKDFIVNYVLPYIEMMLPSTSIVEYLFGGDTSYIETMKSILTATTETYNITPADVAIQEAMTWVENDTWRE